MGHLYAITVTDDGDPWPGLTPPDVFLTPGPSPRPLTFPSPAIAEVFRRRCRDPHDRLRVVGLLPASSPSASESER